MIAPPLQYRVGSATFQVDEDWSMRTVYDDGTVASAEPSFDEEQIARAEALGYERSSFGVLQMHAEHELLHSIVAEAMGRDRSAALYDWAAFGSAPRGLIPLEERMVFLVQRALNVGRDILEERRIAA